MNETETVGIAQFVLKAGVHLFVFDKENGRGHHKPNELTEGGSDSRVEREEWREISERMRRYEKNEKKRKIKRKLKGKMFENMRKKEANF